MDFWSILLGAFLSIIGGIIATYFNSFIDNKDKNIKIKRERLELLFLNLEQLGDWASKNFFSVVKISSKIEIIDKETSNTLNDIKMLVYLYFNKYESKYKELENNFLDFSQKHIILENSEDSSKKNNLNELTLSFQRFSECIENFLITIRSFMQQI